MKIKLIEQGITKDITTKHGVKKKTSWKISTDGKDMFADVWDNKDIDSWFPGETIEVGGLEPRDYNGKTYYTIKLKQVSLIESIRDLEKKTIYNRGRISSNT